MSGTTRPSDGGKKAPPRLPRLHLGELFRGLIGEGQEASRSPAVALV